MKDCLNEIVNENVLLTLKQINEELRGRLPDKPPVCDRTIAKTLNGMLIRVKLARPVPAERNRPDVVERRYEYVNWFMSQLNYQHSLHSIATLLQYLSLCSKGTLKCLTLIEEIHMGYHTHLENACKFLLKI